MSTTNVPSTSRGALSVEDQLAIHELYSRYNRTIDAGNAEGFAECFTAAGVLAVSPDLVVRGAEELSDFARGRYEQRQGRGRHFISNVWAEPSKDGARGGAYFMHLMAPGEGDATTTISRSGIYADELTWQYGEWRFSKRTIHADL